MKPKETIAATVPLPPAPLRRIDAAEKARHMLNGVPDAPQSDPVQPALVKLTTRIFPEQLAWMKDEIARHRARNRRSPRLTVEELTRIALDHLRESRNLDALVSKYRS